VKKLIEGFGIAESPRFHSRWGFLFSDMTGGGVRSFTMAADVTTVIPHRRAIGGVLVHAAGGLVVTGRSVTWRRGSHLADRLDLLERREDEEFFNDAWADEQGRIYVGSLCRADQTGSRPPGRLYRLSLDGSVEVLAEDVLISNGIGGSPDGRAIYHADTGASVIWQYRSDDRDSLHRSEFCDLRDEDGSPDGLAVAADGTVWVAMADGGAVLQIDPQGRPTGVLRVPQALVTATCFGGEDRRTLVITTGTQSDRGDESGSVYVDAVAVPGLAQHEARVRGRRARPGTVEST